MSHEVEERRLKMLIEQYVGVRQTRHDIVSVRQAEATVLTVMGDMIAASAVAHGLGVVFDAQPYPSHMVLLTLR